MADRYKLNQDFEYIHTMTYLRRGDIIEYMRDLDSYVKVKPYGMVQIPASVVKKHTEVFELLPPHEENEYTQPSMLDHYAYMDSRIEPNIRSYAHSGGEEKLLQNGNYFMGKTKTRDVDMATRIIKMILLAIKTPFIHNIKIGDCYYSIPLFQESAIPVLYTYSKSLQDYCYRLMGNCFPADSDGESQARKWAENYQPALYYFLISKF
jgi:hypothetical protein